MSAYRKYRPPTLVQILGGVGFGRPVWLPSTKLVCSRCFRVLKRKRFGKKQQENRVEPVCLECESDESSSPDR
jgi:hypothetical protein